MVRILPHPGQSRLTRFKRRRLRLRLRSVSPSWRGSFLLQLCIPIQHHGNGPRRAFSSVDKKALAIGSDVPGISIQGRLLSAARYTCLEQRFRRSRLEDRSLGYIDGHYVSVERKIEKLLSIAPPARLHTTATRNLRLAASAGGSRERPNVDFEPAGFVGNVCDPMGVGGELALILVELRIRKGHGSAA